MTPSVCRQAFLRSASSADLAMVEGRYDQATKERYECYEAKAGQIATGGSLDMLCEWLGLPRVAVVDVQLLKNCHIPRRPTADAVLLDRVGGTCDFHRWQTNLESLWGIRVIGGLGECATIRKSIAGLAGAAKPTREWCDALVDDWRGYSDVKEIVALATKQGIAGLARTSRGRPDATANCRARRGGI